MGGLLKRLLNLKIQVSKSRAAALGLLALAVLVLYGLIMAPLRALSSGYDESIESLLFRMKRFQTVAAQKLYWEGRLQEIRNEGEQAKNLFSQATPALAAADLQSRIKDTVTSAGGELISTQVIPERKEDQFTRIAVKVRLNGSTEVLRQVLYEIESEQPVLFVENLNLRPIRVPPRPGQKQTAAQDKLSIDFDAVGYMSQKAP
ncbi:MULTISPECIES: type II secretion system protein GspM [Methylococcus]|uniref:Type II secretion system protein GspM n=1 Tax=Methylococcus capsulatus TaxID=414 RepID=A0ABZ2F1L1_METCP|nr:MULTISPECIES: type II secretion system protein GspM [Methylococcus]MDF9392814.1 general secretion pathway protein [Methylococcus capsulatus]UQN13181.1 type II secretion system protein GspM [Methylococcus capsulatus]